MNRNPFAILVDLDRCVGCCACEVACKQENSSSPGTPWIRVNALGPEVVNGKLRADYVPLILDGCDFCQNRGFQPSCVAHCPTEALQLCSTETMLDGLNSKKRYQICGMR